METVTTSSAARLDAFTATASKIPGLKRSMVFYSALHLTFRNLRSSRLYKGETTVSDVYERGLAPYFHYTSKKFTFEEFSLGLISFNLTSL